MDEHVMDPYQEIRRLRDRLKRLDREKANLQMAVDLINQVSSVVGLEDVMSRILHILVSAIGGFNIAIYYESGGRWHYTDLLGDRRSMDELDDPLVRQSVEDQTFLSAAGTGDPAPDRADAQNETWVYPLSVHETYFGAIRLQGMTIRHSHYRENIDPFIQYASLVLYHEISNVRKLESAYREVVTARKALEQTNRLMASVIDNSPQAIMAFDSSRQTILWSRSAAAMFGWEAGEILGGCPGIWDAGAGDTDPVSAVLSGQPVSDVECTCRRRDGRAFDALVSASPILDDEKIIQGGMAVISDISWRKQAERRMQQTQKMESIGNLAGGIAHDFNNLLFPIVGLSELLMEDLPKESHQHQNAREILRAGLRGRDLVKQILSFSRQTEHKISPVRVQAILKEVLKLSRSTIPVDIEIRQSIQADCGRVMADPTQLHQIAMNIITNAFHAVEDRGGTIDVRLRQVSLAGDAAEGYALPEGDYALFSVSDNGTGIPAGNLDKIFEPYFTTKKKGKGTGLGLSVVYGIVKEHKGDIKVYSEPGKGSTFNILLPLMKTDSNGLASHAPAEIPGGTEHLLLVDDEDAIIRLQKQMLMRLGYRVTAITDSREALDIFERDPQAFDAVITDMTMPFLTGSQLTRELMKIRPDIPVILCTGFSGRINPDSARAMGIRGFLMKPVVRSEMAATIRGVLDAGDDPQGDDPQAE